MDSCPFRPDELRRLVSAHPNLVSLARAVGRPRSTVGMWLYRRGIDPKNNVGRKAVPCPLSPEALRAVYDSAGSIKAAADVSGVAFCTFRRWLADAGIALRPRGGQRKP